MEHKPFLLILLGVAVIDSMAHATECQGLLTDSYGVYLAPAPDSRPTQKSLGSLALVVEQRELVGKPWRRLIASDGGFGWTLAGGARPAAATLVPGIEPFALMAKPPGEQGFESAGETPVETAAKGCILGASATPAAASMGELMLPEWLGAFRSPWLLLRFADRTGYAAPAWVRLSWDSGSTPAEAFSRVQGLIRQPFAGPFEGLLLKLLAAAPTTLPTLTANGEAAERSPAEAQWRRLEALYVEPSDRSRAVAAFADGAARQFLFIEKGKPILRIVRWEDSPGIVRVGNFDLNGDGRSEWLLETASRYGDGFYSSLWHVDAGAPGNQPIFTSVPLSQSSGETAGPGTVASWWVGEGRTLWVGGADGKGAWLEQFRYAAGKLAAAKAPETLRLGIETKSEDYWDAHAVALERERSGSAVAQFPIALHGHNPVWAVGVPLTDPKEIREWLRRNPNTETIRPRRGH